MEDLTKDMRSDKPISPKMRALLDQEKLEARNRIIERGIVHFRGDKEFMEALFDAAEQSKTAPGALCRSIVWEHLKTLRSQQAGNAPLGKKLSPNEPMLIDVQTLVAAIDALNTRSDKSGRRRQK